MLKVILLSGASVLAFATAADAVTFPYSGVVETWVAPKAGVYDIVAAGAQGGGSNPISHQFGGLGAVVGGDIALSAGATLNIVVGGPGAGGYNVGYGGGGGSFVFESLTAPLLVAGGGGGAPFLSGSGGAGQVGAAGSGQGGAAVGDGVGGGGAGWFGNGQSSGGYKSGFGGAGPASFKGGYGCYAGAPGRYCGSVYFGKKPYEMSGGFGGGGGYGYTMGGGGGGFTGGAGNGGGGTSYIAPGFTNTSAAGGVNRGFGYVNISAVPEPSVWSLLLGGFGLIGYQLRRRMLRKA